MKLMLSCVVLKEIFDLESGMYVSNGAGTRLLIKRARLNVRFVNMYLVGNEKTRCNSTSLLLQLPIDF